MAEDVLNTVTDFLVEHPNSEETAVRAASENKEVVQAGVPYSTYSGTFTIGSDR